MVNSPPVVRYAESRRDSSRVHFVSSLSRFESASNGYPVTRSIEAFLVKPRNPMGIVPTQ